MFRITNMKNSTTTVLALTLECFSKCRTCDLFSPRNWVKLFGDTLCRRTQSKFGLNVLVKPSVGEPCVYGPFVNTFKFNNIYKGT